jgi:hypothetical protein
VAGKKQRKRKNRSVSTNENHRGVKITTTIAGKAGGQRKREKKKAKEMARKNGRQRKKKIENRKGADGGPRTAGMIISAAFLVPWPADG